jgi:hypothetical protein
MTHQAKQIPLPPAARSLSSLPRIDYEDAFVVETEHAMEFNAEDWARKILEGAPTRFKVTAPATWFALGLKHGLPWSGENILGWPVRRSEPDFVVLGGQSRTGMPAELLIKREENSVLIATMIQHKSPVMKRVWSLIEGPHQRVVPALLARSVRQCDVAP